MTKYEESIPQTYGLNHKEIDYMIPSLYNQWGYHSKNNTRLRFYYDKMTSKFARSLHPSSDRAVQQETGARSKFMDGGEDEQNFLCICLFNTRSC